MKSIIYVILALTVVFFGSYYLYRLHIINTADGEALRIRIPYVTAECEPQIQYVRVQEPGDSTFTLKMVEEPCSEGIPVEIVLFFTLLGGVLIGFFFALIQIMILKGQTLTLKNAIRRLEGELNELRNQSITDEIALRDANESIDL